MVFELQVHKCERVCACEPKWFLQTAQSDSKSCHEISMGAFATLPCIWSMQLGPRGSKRAGGVTKDGEELTGLKSSGGSSSKLPREAYVQQTQMDGHLATPQVCAMVHITS